MKLEPSVKLREGTSSNINSRTLPTGTISMSDINSLT